MSNKSNQKITPKVGSLEKPNLRYMSNKSKQKITPKVGNLSGATRMLYHQTSHENADMILKSKYMNPGKDGVCGGAIYFAETPKKTNNKARNSGVLLECYVHLGRLKTHRKGTIYTKESLRKEGYDSVVINWLNGKEYAVFDSSRILSMNRIPLDVPWHVLPYRND